MLGTRDRDALDRRELFALAHSLDMISVEQTVEFDYAYDEIGNRETSAVDGSTRVYTTNDLNQYHPITNPDETVFYDDDGNLSQEVWQDHVLQLLWDGENRLIQVTHVVPAESVRSVTYSYDYLGRMVRRQVERFDTTQQPAAWQTDSVTLYVYDGWRMILELDALDEDAPLRSHYWGLDLSGTLDGAAGIGGLPATVDHDIPTTYFVLCDGHGNVTQLVDASDGSEAAEFEYDPYGNRLDTRSDQPLPFGFSTKFLEPETGLYYYGFRWYQAEWGRWVSRDPIGEKGGINTYSYDENAPFGSVDPVGLALYAIDGTWADWGEGTNTEQFYRSTFPAKYYWSGPDLPVMGTDATFIIGDVMDTICSDYCKDPSDPINMVGWSRGAAIILQVAKHLNDSGCCCCGDKGHFGICLGSYKREKPVPVNFAGLFDAVRMMPEGAMQFSPNVSVGCHAKKTKSQLLYPTLDTGGIQKEFRKHNGEPTTHGDIGKNRENNDAYQWIVEQAMSAGVPVTGL